MSSSSSFVHGMDSFLCSPPLLYMCVECLYRPLLAPSRDGVSWWRSLSSWSFQTKLSSSRRRHALCSWRSLSSLICPCYVRLMGLRVPDECLAPAEHHNQPFPWNPSNFKDPFRTHHQAKKEWMRLFFLFFTREYHVLNVQARHDRTAKL